MRVLDSVTATIAGDEAMVTCAAQPCTADPVPALRDAVRLNAAVGARRLPPPELRQRTQNPELGCPR